MRSNSTGVAGFFALLTLIASAHAQPRTPREALEENHPGVQFHEPRGRVLTVYGERMTAQATSRQAADAWVALYGEVFAEGGLELEHIRAVPLSGDERTMHMYWQTMDGLRVVGSTFRLMTFGHAPSRAVYAGARVAIRPEGGLPEPTVTPAQAAAAAQAHRQGEGLSNWSEPELVAIYDDAPTGNAVAYSVWRCVGTRARPFDSRTFYVHAVTGAVARHHSNISNVRDITGTVSGKATPAFTDTQGNEHFGPDTSAFTSQCPNDEENVTPQDMLIEAFQGATPIASDYTAANGTYSLGVANSTVVNVHASFIGPWWEVLDGSDEPFGEPIDPLIVSNVTAPASGVNFSFNSSPSELGTSIMNAHVQMARVSEYLGFVGDEIPPVPVVVQSDEAVCGGEFVPQGADEDPPYPGVLRFNPASGGCPNSAFSTHIAHEYGHFLVHHLMGIVNDFSYAWPFHEGLGDALAHLVYGTPVMGQDFEGCNNHLREPLVEDPEYFVCPSVPFFSGHEFGMLLSALWLDIRGENGLDSFNDTRTLFRDWIGIAQLPPDRVECPGFKIDLPQAAGESTLIEILTADSPDGNPAHAEHLGAICFVFDERGITTGVCADSAGSSRTTDCDHSGTLDVFDFLCFQNQFTAGRRSADCDRDGSLTVLDFACFQKKYVEAIR